MQVNVTVCGVGKWVGVEELYMHNNPKAPFFTATLRLFTDMCTGRNYNCIVEIESMFPRDVVFSVRPGLQGS